MTRGQSADSVAACVQWVQSRLEEAQLNFGHGTDNAFDEAAWLVCHTAGIDPATLDLAWQRPLGAACRDRLRVLTEERIRTRKPTAYLTQSAWFAGLKFYVDERVLVPRSYLGEWLQDGLAPWVAPDSVQRGLDLCTGSGCIAVATALAFPAASIDATDLCADALDVARINVATYELEERIRLVHSDLFAAVEGNRYDLITANPPYVGTEAMASLPPEYRHEPAAALAAGEDGLDIIVRILADARRFLTDSGTLVLEAGSAAPALERAFGSVAFTWLTCADGTSPVLVLTAAELDQQAAALAR